jgi:uncharacterized protein YndB with AHSA1/START domain
MSQATTEFVYTTYITSTPQKVWDAITTAEFTRQYWGHAMVSDWKAGSKWEMQRADGGVQMSGQVLESRPPSRLVYDWASPENLGNKSETSRVTFSISAIGGVVRLDVVHDQLKTGSEMALGISKGWPLVLSGLKSWLETGKAADILAIKTASCGQAEAEHAKVA